MPTLERELRRYGELLDDATGATPSISATTARPWRATGTALVAVAVVVVVSLVAVVSSARSTHEPTPATAPTVAPTTTTTSNPQVAAAEEAARRARAQAWIAAHGGTVFAALDSVLDIAMSDRAIYTWSSFAAGDRVGTLSRVDRRTLRINSVKVPQSAGWLSVGGNAVYLLTTRAGHNGMQVSRLDPDTLRALWTTPLADATAIDDASQIAGNTNGVWVTSGHDIEQFDAQSGARVHSVNLTLPTSSTQIYLTLDPSGHVLYVAYGDDSGATQPLQKRDARTGEFSRLAPTGNETAAGGFTAPQLAATAGGVWVTGQTPASRGKTVASFYRTNGLGRAATLTAGGDTGRPGLTIAVAGATLWNWNSTFIACADASSGHALSSNRLDNVTADSLAADATSVAVSIDGTLGIFAPHDLCGAAR